MGSIIRNPGVPTTRQVIAGTNMTGGGALTGDVTLNSSGGGAGGLLPFGFFGSMPTAGFLDTFVNSSGVYVNTFITMWIDFSVFNATSFLIRGRGASTEAAQTIDMQLCNSAGTALHTGGNDVTGLPNSNTDINTGWRTIDISLTNVQQLILRMKGSNGTVDFRAVQTMNILFK